MTDAAREARPTIAVAVHDGFYGCGTGAGHANLGFLECLTDLLPDRVRLVVLPLRLAPTSPEHHPDWHRRARIRLDCAAVLPVDNSTGGQNRWGTLANFRSLSADTARVLVTRVLPHADPLLIIAFDVPFFGVAAALPIQVRHQLVLVPRSSAVIHTPHDHVRIDWERAGLHAGLSNGTRVGVISPFMHRHLRRDYGLRPAALVRLHDGLSPSDWARPREVPEIRSDFVLAMGRAEPYKGFDDLLDAYATLLAGGQSPPHLVLAATAESSLPTPYQLHLQDRVESLGIDATVMTNFTPAVAALLHHPRLRAVVVPSRVEPFGRIPMEAFAAGAVPVVATTADGLAGQITDGITGFTCHANSPRTLADALTRAFSLTPEQRSAMRARARQLALRDYDHPAAVRRFLTAAAPWLHLPEPDDRLRWLSRTSPYTSGSPVSDVPPVKVPIGLQAPHWTTIETRRHVLIVAHHVTSLLRLLDVLTVFDSDHRIQVVFTWNGSDPFRHGLHEYLDRLGVITIPWSQAIDTEFDLVIAANHGGLTEISAPLVILPHGAGYTKNSPGNRKPETGNRKPETGNRKPETGNRSVFGLSPEWLLYNGQPIASSLVLAHDAERERLAELTPAALHTAVVAGDPAYDRMVASRHLRSRYREALGVDPHQKLMTICSTWWRNSLLGSRPSLIREIMASLDRDRYRVAALIHPNVWHGHGPWQVHTWLADCVRAGLLLPAPVEGWQATLIASDLILGDHGATTGYGACLDLPVLLATFPENDVAPDSLGAVLGATARRLNRHESPATQVRRALAEYQPGTFDAVRELVTSCPGESVQRLRRLFYGHLRLPEPHTGQVVPVIPAAAVASVDRTPVRADHVVCAPVTDTDAGFALRRYPADIEVDRSLASYLDDAFLVVHDDHPASELRSMAPVVVVASPAAGETVAEVLDDALTRRPAAVVAATTAQGVITVRTRSGLSLSTPGRDACAAASVVHEWLLRRRDPADLLGDTRVLIGEVPVAFRFESVVVEHGS